MALQENLSAPENVKQALRDKIPDYLDEKDPLRKPLLEFKIEIPISSLAVDEIKELANQNLQPTAWRFMARYSGVFIAADVAVGPPARMIGISRDKVLGELLAAIITKVQTFGPTDYILVRILAVLTDVLWMRTDGQIRIAPLRTKARGLTQETYTVDELEPIIQELAEEFKPGNGDEPTIPSFSKPPKQF